MAQSTERLRLRISEHSHLPTRTHNSGVEEDSKIDALHTGANGTVNITSNYKH